MTLPLFYRLLLLSTPDGHLQNKDLPKIRPQKIKNTTNHTISLIKCWAVFFATATGVAHMVTAWPHTCISEMIPHLSYVVCSWIGMWGENSRKHTPSPNVLTWLIAGHNSLRVIVRGIIGVSESQKEQIIKEALVHSLSGSRPPPWITSFWQNMFSFKISIHLWAPRADAVFSLIGSNKERELRREPFKA